MLRKIMVKTAEAVADAMGTRLGSAVDPTSIRESIEDYLDMLRPPELDLSKFGVNLKDSE